MAIEQPKFEWELSDFLFVTKNMINGKGLRCSFTWRVEHPEYGILGMTIPGCLITRRRDGKLRFNPPVNRFGTAKFAAKSFAQITTDLHDTIIAKLMTTRYPEYIGNDIPKELKPKYAYEIDPNLPKTV